MLERSSPFEQRTVSIINNNMRCERNLQYASRIENYFRMNGWSVEESFDTDLVAIAGCGFHDAQYEKIRSAIATMRKAGCPDTRVVVMGCLPKTHGDLLRNWFDGDLVELGSEAELDALIGAHTAFADVTESNVLIPRAAYSYSREKADRSFFIRLGDGCTSHCTFCVIRQAKGYIKSAPPEDIERQFRQAVETGRRHVCLIGEDALAYGVDAGTTIVELLHRLVAIDANVEFSLTSVHGMWLPVYRDELIELCRAGVICELRMGLQHVNPHLLQRMGRKGEIDQIYRIVRLLRESSSRLHLEADVIVGFPGETEEMFEELLEFLREDECFDRVQHFVYSDVHGAAATRMADKIPRVEQMRRWQAVDRVLEERSSYRRKQNYDRMGDALFKVSHESNFAFCKDLSGPVFVELKIGRQRPHETSDLAESEFSFEASD